MYEVHIKRPIIALAVGFFVILMLMSVLIFYTAQKMQYAYQQVEDVIQVNNKKINLSYKMRLIGRERSIALQGLFLLDNPFERDEAWMNYSELAGKYIGYAQQLSMLPLTDWEKALLVKQGQLTDQTKTVQDKIRVLIFSGQKQAAKRLFLEKAMPVQEQVFELGYYLIHLQEEYNEEVMDDMYDAYKMELSFLIIIGIIIFSISIAIAIYLVLNLGKLNKHLLSLIEDRTYDLQQAKEHAEHTTQSKTHYLAYVTHEIRNPVHGMLGLVEASLEENLPNRAQKYLDTVQQSGEMLLLLLNDVLDLSKIEAGKLSLEYLDFNLNRNIHSVIDLLQGRLQQQELSIQVNIDPQLPAYIHSEPTRLKQILINLLSNAIKFTPQGGQISLQVYAKKDSEQAEKFQLFCCIKDTGQGISEENITNLFQAYQQADESISRQFGGTGLGLLLSRQLVEMMDGEIWVKSIVGKGSEFSFYVQCRQVKNTPTSSMEMDLGDTLVKFKQGLLVEDNSVNRQVAALALKKFVQHLDFSHNGQEAVDACLTQQYDIIFMDCYMPVLDGFAATKQIRQIPHYQHIPIIAMTGSTMTEERQRCFDVGMNDILLKPYKREDLKQTLKKYYLHHMLN